MFKNDRKGFTLIELLVVIAIIGILAAILFPVFARARENARRTGCLSNVKQLGLAFMQYSQDYDEQLPLNGQTASVKSWDVNIAPYAGVKVATGSSPAIFRCPSDSTDDKNRSYAVPYSGNYAGSTDFADANTVFGYDNAAALIRGVALAAIPEPSVTLLMVERPSSPASVPMADPTFNLNLFGNFSSSVCDSPVQASFMQWWQDKATPGTTYHMEGWNYLFADGHAKWLRPQATLGQAARATLKAPGNMWRRYNS